MKFKEESSNKYRAQFKRATEALINEMTVDEFIEYLENNETLKIENCEHVNGIKRCRVYSLKETDELYKIFLVTEDGRLFYYKSLLEKAELVDEEKTDKKVTVKEVKMPVTDTTVIVLQNFILGLTEKANENWLPVQVQMLKELIMKTLTDKQEE